jgi:hypothetical protein
MQLLSSRFLFEEDMPRKLDIKKEQIIDIVNKVNGSISDCAKYFEENNLCSFHYFYKLVHLHGLKNYSGFKVLRDKLSIEEIVNISNIVKGTRRECARYCEENNICSQSTFMKSVVRYELEGYFPDEKIRQGLRIKKSEKTCLSRHGVKSTSQLNSTKKKYKETNMFRYGVDHPSKTEWFQEKKKKTNQKKYNADYGLQNIDVKKKREETTLRNHGVKNPFESPVFQKKAKESLLNRHGTDKISKSNLNWQKKLFALDIDSTFECTIGTLSYDLHITGTNILLEINPTYTHNSTFGTHWQKGLNPKSTDYHYKKSLNAHQNGYRCLHVWEWSDCEDILKTIQEWISNPNFGIFNPDLKPRMHLTKQNNNYVEVWDDGQLWNKRMVRYEN